MRSTLSTVVVLVGIALMAACGSQIARHIGVEQWQMAGFAAGLLMCAIAPTWDLQRRLKKMQDEFEKIHRDGSARSS
jgi:predicted MFS family arabinose efflux permease